MVLRTSEEFLLDYGKTAPKEHAIIFPLAWFLVSFARPREFASRLCLLAKNLITEWNNFYRRAKPGQRLSVEKILPLGEGEFYDRVIGRTEKAQIRLTLSNYLYVLRNQQAAKLPSLKLGDLRVSKRS